MPDVRCKWDGRPHPKQHQMYQSGSVEQPRNREGVTRKITTIGVELAKNVFQVHGVNRSEKPLWRKKLNRQEWLKIVLEQIEPGCEIGMEACSSAHPWARQLQKMGYTVKLLALQFVKPYVESNKNDANDAKAIC